MSDRGLPRNFRQKNGYGSHTYSFINENGERYWVKFHFKSMQGHAFYTDQEAAEVVGSDRESAQRDLFENIEGGDYPRWRFCVQIMPETAGDSAAADLPFLPCRSGLWNRRRPGSRD